MFLEEKKQGEVTEAPARTMKLSQAIRIGARLRPQCRRYFFADGGSCAWGAAYEAVTGRITGHDFPRVFIEDIVKFFPQFAESRMAELRSIIADMNDHGESREQIADWLEAQGF